MLFVFVYVVICFSIVLMICMIVVLCVIVCRLSSLGVYCFFLFLFFVLFRVYVFTSALHIYASVYVLFVRLIVMRRVA